MITSSFDQLKIHLFYYPLPSCLFARPPYHLQLLAISPYLHRLECEIAMLDLYDESRALISRITEAGIAYALCNGLALSIYGIVRTTIDIDLPILRRNLDAIRHMAASLGFDVEAKPKHLPKPSHASQAQNSSPVPHSPARP